MGNQENLFSEEAVAKVKEMAKNIKTCMFCTELSIRPIPTRPMTVSEVDDAGNLWFISSAESNKNFEIKHDNEVQLMFAENSGAKYLSVLGEAVVYTDESHVDDIWKPVAKAWFEEGKKDPNATVIKVTPKDAYYWDTKNGKMIAMLKMAASAVTGKKADIGVEGKLNV